MEAAMTQVETTGRAIEDETAAADAVGRLRAVVGRLGRQLRATQAGAGLTPTQISVLFSLARRGPLRLSELAEIEGLNPTMLSRVTAQLADDGLLKRAADPSDRRAAVVDATPRGRRLREKIHRERNKVLGAQLDALSPADRDSLIAALPALEALADQLRTRSR
ncbi:MAG TPA: MarR family transcriptional regulator [Solirubrobacteraceae bacterium]|nr:MarR family transcriptional regulator [Solirubrobacteraceae bacterium]